MRGVTAVRPGKPAYLNLIPSKLKQHLWLRFSSWWFSGWWSWWDQLQLCFCLLAQASLCWWVSDYYFFGHSLLCKFIPILSRADVSVRAILLAAADWLATGEDEIRFCPWGFDCVKVQYQPIYSVLAWPIFSFIYVVIDVTLHFVLSPVPSKPIYSQVCVCELHFGPYFQLLSHVFHLNNFFENIVYNAITI